MFSVLEFEYYSQSHNSTYKYQYHFSWEVACFISFVVRISLNFGLWFIVALKISRVEDHGKTNHIRKIHVFFPNLITFLYKSHFNKKNGKTSCYLFYCIGWQMKLLLLWSCSKFGCLPNWENKSITFLFGSKDEVI